MKRLVAIAALVFASPAAAQTLAVNPEDLRSIDDVLASQPDQTDNDRLSYIAVRCAALNAYVGAKIEQSFTGDELQDARARDQAAEAFMDLGVMVEQAVGEARGMPVTDADASNAITSRVLTTLEYYMARAKRNLALTGNMWSDDPVFEADLATCRAALEALVETADRR